MTTAEILQIETGNMNSIHFFLEGSFWHVYERSAFLFCRHLMDLKLTRKYVKAVETDIIYGGFPKDRLVPLLEKAQAIGARIQEFGDKNCTFTGFSELDGFELWRDSYVLKEKGNEAVAVCNLPVFKAMYDLILALFDAIRNIPKDFQYTLGERIKTESIALSELIHKANLTGDLEKRVQLIETACVKSETVRFLIRMCYDLHLWNLERHVDFNDKMESVVKQLNGWKKK